MKKICLLLLLMFAINIARADALNYHVFKADKHIGNIHIKRSINNGLTEYFFESTVKLTFLMSIEVYDRMKVTFKGNQMIKALLYRTLNGRVRVNNIATWTGQYYSMTNKDKENSTLKQLVSLTTANLYYHEPATEQVVFSENFQRMLPIKHIGNKRYEMRLPNGNRTYYSYKNGICNLVEAETDWASLRFVLHQG